MRLLVLGGTVFLGRAVVEAALARGDEVTLFHRGEHGGELFPDADRIVGDRTHDLDRLAGRRFDVVVDTCGFVPRDVGASAQRLADAVDRYVFVSSVSAYTRWPLEPAVEGAPLHPMAPDGGPGDGEYGELKAGCERAAERELPGRVLHVRPGLIVGPHENIGRLPAWLRRAARGGELLAPEQPGSPLQLIDARDLASWMLEAAARGASGAMNAVSPRGARTIGDLVDACVAATEGRAEPVWASADAIEAAGIEAWTELTLWAPARGETAEIFTVETQRAEAAGLRCRPLAETVRDTWRWLVESGATAPQPGELDPERERAAIELARAA